jgi:hypothetical protein
MVRLYGRMELLRVQELGVLGSARNLAPFG